MTDPEALYAKLAAGDAGRIMTAVEPILAARTALERAADGSSSGTTAAAAAWRGAAADEFATRAELTGRAATGAADRLTDAASVVEAAATAYRTMRTGADRAIEAWRARPADLAPAALTSLAERVTEALGLLRDSYERTLRAYAAALGKLEPTFASVAGTTPSWQAATPRTGLTVPPPTTDPRAVAAWWAGLSESERDQLMATRFDDLGRLRGLPAPVLNDANLRRIEVDRTRYASASADLTAQITARATALGLDPTDEGALRANPAFADLLDQRQEANRRRDNAEDAADRVADAGRLAEANGITDGTYVLSYDVDGPGSGDGALAIAYGNPDAARNVAVLVPGTGTTLTDWYPNADAAELRAQMDALAPGNATIAWLGYDAPSWDLSVATADNAKAGGHLLVSDVEGYRAAALGDQHVTVLGHSYGSTTVGYAAMNGLAADDIAFLGSPGVGASDVDQLSPGPGHVWAGASEHDPIVQGTSGDWFTEDGSSTGPYDESFGANQFAVPDETNLVEAHAVYYAEGSESLRNLGNIATGNHDAVTSPDWVDSPLPPELPGSHLPVVGPVVDGVGQVGKETVDIVSDVGSGVWDAGRNAADGEWDAAWSELESTGRELLNDTGDVVVGVLGDAVEGGRDLVEAGVDGARSLYDNTLGRLF